MKAMPFAGDMKNLIEDIVYSYEARIQSIETIFDTTNQLLNVFQDSYHDTRQEREKINDELRENLAKNESLRRKDFDNMMQDILSIQDEREKEVRNLLNIYVNEQKEMAQALRENLGKFNNSIVKGGDGRVKEFRALINEILAKQNERKKDVTSKLKEFQNEQKELKSRLKELLAKGGELRIRDLKSMLKEFRTQREERLARQIERKKEVYHLLGEFKKERIEAAKNWRNMKTKLAQKRAGAKTDELNVNTQIDDTK